MMGTLLWIIAKGSSLLGLVGKLLMKPYVLLSLAIVVLFAAAWISNRSLDRMTADRDNWRRSSADGFAYAKAWEKSYREDARLRGAERLEAVTAINEAGKACQTRVDAARASAAKIEALVTKEPTYDAKNCPRRELWSSDVLRDATGWSGENR
jgi:hypothetical protein